MKLEMTGQMRMEQRMKLAPHMIQSMEILQLPILALQERIEQELNSNPVLELDDDSNPDEVADAAGARSGRRHGGEGPGRGHREPGRGLRAARAISGTSSRTSSISRAPITAATNDDEKDLKLEAIKNTAAPPQSLHDYLTEQWRLVDADEPVKKAGSTIIDYIDDRGYLSVPLEQLHNKDQTAFTPEHLREALLLVQELDPPGVGARDLRECLLIQLAQSSDDLSFEYRLVADHMDALLENRLPEIAKKMDCTIERLNRAIERLSKLDISPGLQVGRNDSIPITPDVIVESPNGSERFLGSTGRRQPAQPAAEPLLHADGRGQPRQRHHARSSW